MRLMILNCPYMGLIMVWVALSGLISVCLKTSFFLPKLALVSTIITRPV